MLPPLNVKSVCQNFIKDLKIEKKNLKKAHFLLKKKPKTDLFKQKKNRPKNKKKTKKKTFSHFCLFAMQAPP